MFITGTIVDDTLGSAETLVYTGWRQYSGNAMPSYTLELFYAYFCAAKLKSIILQCKCTCEHMYSFERVFHIIKVKHSDITLSGSSHNWHINKDWGKQYCVLLSLLWYHIMKCSNEVMEKFKPKFTVYQKFHVSKKKSQNLYEIKNFDWNGFKTSFSYVFWQKN